MSTSDVATAEVEKLIRRLEKLHTSPAVALQVVELTRDPEFEIFDVVRCLESDPALSASVLRLVNSSYYGLRRQITDIRQAMVYLGRRSLRLAVLGFGLVKTLSQGSPKEFHQRYWRRSLTMAVGARMIAGRMEHHKLDPQAAFTAGLLADLGMVVLAQLETERYMPLCTIDDHVSGLLDAERKTFGFTHVDVGSQLLQYWQLPEDLIHAVAAHHACSGDAPPLNQVLRTANVLSEVLWTAESPHMKILLPLLSTRHRMNVDNLITLANDCKHAVLESVDIFQVHLQGEMDLEAIEQQARHVFESAALEAANELDDIDILTDGITEFVPLEPPRSFSN